MPGTLPRARRHRRYASGVESATRTRIDGHWSRRFGVPVPGLVPVVVAASGRHEDAVLVLLLGDHAYVDAPLHRVAEVAELALAHDPGALLDPATWSPLAAGPVLGPADHFWADHETPLTSSATLLDAHDHEELRSRVTAEEWREAGFDRTPHVSYGVVEDDHVVAASVLTSLWGWPVDVGVLVAPQVRGRGLGTEVAAAALAAGVQQSGFAAVRVARTNAGSRAVAGRLGLTAHGANVAVPLA